VANGKTEKVIKTFIQCPRWSTPVVGINKSFGFFSLIYPLKTKMGV
jgi:hypothetical protein